MTVGFEAYNDSRTLQFDATSANFVFRTKGVGTFHGDTYGHGIIYTAAITVTAGTPLLAFSSTNRCVILKVVYNGSGSWTFTVACRTAVDGQNFNWWLFDLARNVPNPERVGIELYDSSGNLTYYTSSKAMKLVGLVTNYGNTTFTGISGRIYAAIQFKLGYVHTVIYNDGGTGGGGRPGTGGGGGTTLTGSVSTSYIGCSVNNNAIATGSNIYENYNLYNSSTTGEGSLSSAGCTFGVIDVTGL